jgi:hypothetical protein
LSGRAHFGESSRLPDSRPMKLEDPMAHESGEGCETLDSSA